MLNDTKEKDDIYKTLVTSLIEQVVIRDNVILTLKKEIPEEKMKELLLNSESQLALYKMKEMNRKIKIMLY